MYIHFFLEVRRDLNDRSILQHDSVALFEHPFRCAFYQNLIFLIFEFCDNWHCFPVSCEFQSSILGVSGFDVIVISHGLLTLTLKAPVIMLDLLHKNSQSSFSRCSYGSVWVNSYFLYFRFIAQAHYFHHFLKIFVTFIRVLVQTSDPSYRIIGVSLHFMRHHWSL